MESHPKIINPWTQPRVANPHILMAPTFVFEPPSDEEYSEAEEEEYSDAQEEEEEQVQEEIVKPSRLRNSQSPWDFASYSETVAEEHARRSTTSVDDKISKARQQLSVPLPDDVDASSSGSESESDKQVTNCFVFLSINSFT